MIEFCLRLYSRGPEDTYELGRSLGKSLKPGAIIALEGNLGCGKTVLVKGLAKGLGIGSGIRSPTFALIQEHMGRVPLCHADLYRISPREAADLGLEEYWREDRWVCAIEWSEKAEGFLPSNALKIKLRFSSSKSGRDIILIGDKTWKKIGKSLKVKRS